MPRIDFYIAPQRSPLLLACQITEKGWRHGYSIYLHARDEEMAAQLDSQLWSFRDTSFLPHQRLDQPRTDELLRIGIGYGDSPPAELTGVVINLAPELALLPFIDRFERMSEIVPHDEAGKMAARQRYRLYQERGYPLETHHL